ncbi:MAG TPA: dTDP-4-dehydrorhamnose 3,5-epimerase [Terriglobales bacterium]|nr:dTDP-4-dehydrorhamnose 3,5-epimerase [Terriglobales bacterium]
MKATTTPLSGVLLLEPRVFKDGRGFFLESYNENIMRDLGITDRFVQDNHSYSTRSVIRGLHYQICHPQGKLVRVAVGEVLDVALDLRRSSLTFGRWHGEILSGENCRMLWIPPGFAHGFHALSSEAHVLYKATDFYYPECERTVLWSDADLNIDWRLDRPAIVSAKDAQGSLFRDADSFD